MPSFARVTAIPVLIVLFAGCQPVKIGGTDGGGDDADHADGGAGIDADTTDATLADPCADDIAFEDMTACYLAAICDMNVRCYGMFGTIEECIDAGSGLFDVDMLFRRIGDAIGADRVSYDGEAAAECLASIHTADCALLQEGDGPPGPACDQVFTGLVDAGNTCYSSDDCADNGTCGQTGDCYLQCCAGLCQARAGLGSNCESTSCVEGAHCVYTPGAGFYLCQTGEANSPCGSDWECDTDFWCDVDGGGLCTADLPADSSCSDDAQCPLPQLCVGDDTSSGLGTCARADTLSAACDDECYGPYYCLANPNELGECANLPGEGQSCALSYRCAGSHLRCDSNSSLCVPLLALHSACTQTGQCEQGLICTADLPGGADPGQCENPIDDGLSCNSDRQCLSDVCAGDPAVCEPYANCYE